MLKHFLLNSRTLIEIYKTFSPKKASANWLRRLYPSWYKDKRNVVAVPKSNRVREELRSSYVRFEPNNRIRLIGHVILGLMTSALYKLFSCYKYLKLNFLLVCWAINKRIVQMIVKLRSRDLQSRDPLMQHLIFVSIQPLTLRSFTRLTKPSPNKWCCLIASSQRKTIYILRSF